MKKQIKLRTKILLLSSILVCISVLVSGLTMLVSVSASFEEEIGERAIAIARTIAQMDDIRNAVGRPNGEEVIQPIAERIRVSTNVDYIVILDMNRIRYSHPSESRIGQVFEGGDELAAFSELEYTSKAEGELGYAIRAFVPIMNEEGVEQVGVAVVGILSPTFQSLIQVYQKDLLISLYWGLIIGLVGAWLLANNVKKQTYQLEPYEIARLFEERSTMMETLDIGIIATDDQGKVTYMNRQAEKYTEISFAGELSIDTIFPQPWMTKDLFRKGKLTNKPINIRGTMYLISIHPLFVKNHYLGSLLTLKNRSEAEQLGEELTGVKSLVSALRAQNHEYMNKLHSIAGLIQLGNTEKALELIIDETSYEENTVQFMRDRIQNYGISGLLLGKRSLAKEAGVELCIDSNSYLTELMDGISAGDMITILGNLLNNAIEACTESGTKKVTCLLQGKSDYLYISVEDTGHGMTEEEQSRIFEHGYSSKGKEGRGIGLVLVKEIVDANNGRISVQSEKGRGTTVIIEIASLEKEGFS